MAKRLHGTLALLVVVLSFLSITSKALADCTRTTRISEYGTWAHVECESTDGADDPSVYARFSGMELPSLLFNSFSSKYTINHATFNGDYVSDRDGKTTQIREESRNRGSCVYNEGKNVPLETESHAMYRMSDSGYGKLQEGLVEASSKTPADLNLFDLPVPFPGTKFFTVSTFESSAVYKYEDLIEGTTFAGRSRGSVSEVLRNINGTFKKVRSVELMISPPESVGLDEVFIHLKSLDACGDWRKLDGQTDLVCVPVNSEREREVVSNAQRLVTALLNGNTTVLISNGVHEALKAVTAAVQSSASAGGKKGF